MPVSRSLVLGFAAAFGLGVALAPSAASARQETLRWTHPNPSQVARFQVYVGFSSRSYGAPIAAGLPAAAAGVYSFPVTISDGATVYTAITAVDAQGNESVYSNERTFAPAAAPAPAPAPAPTPAEPPPAWEASGEVLWSDDLETASTGAAPAGWYSTDSVMARNDSLFTVQSLGGSRVLATSSDLVNIHSHYVAPESDGWGSAYELRGRMLATSSTAGIGITAFSDFPSSDTYYRLRSAPIDGLREFHLAPHPWALKTVSCTQDRAGIVPASGRWYRFRLQVAAESSGTRIRARVWDEAGAEPSAWPVDCLDASSDRLTGGRIGVWSMGSGSKYWDDLAVTELGGGIASPPASPAPAPAPEVEPLGPPGKPQIVLP